MYLFGFIARIFTNLNHNRVMLKSSESKETFSDFFGLSYSNQAITVKYDNCNVKHVYILHLKNTIVTWYIEILKPVLDSFRVIRFIWLVRLDVTRTKATSAFVVEMCTEFVTGHFLVMWAWRGHPKKDSFVTTVPHLTAFKRIEPECAKSGTLLFFKFLCKKFI